MERVAGFEPVTPTLARCPIKIGNFTVLSLFCVFVQLQGCASGNRFRTFPLASVLYRILYKAVIYRKQVGESSKNVAKKSKVMQFGRPTLGPFSLLNVSPFWYHCEVQKLLFL